MELFYGNAVRGKQRFPRPVLEAELLRLLEHSAGIKMFGLRRIGKSTLTLVAQEEMERRGYGVIKVDAQGMRSLDQLLFGVFHAMPRQDDGRFGRLATWFTGDEAIPATIRAALEGALKGVVGSSAAVSDSVAQYWPTISREIIRTLQRDQPKLLLTIDELPFMVSNLIADRKNAGAHQVDLLLASLREWRGAGLKMLLTGSIGMAGLARQHGFSIDHINDLSHFQVPPLTETEARGFIKAATDGAPGAHWSEAHTEALLHEAGVFYPCFLVKGLLAVGNVMPPPPEKFIDIFADRVRPELHDAFLSQFNRRFSIYKGLDKKLRKKLIVPMLRKVLEAGDAGCLQSALAGVAKDPFDAVDASEALMILQEDGFLHYTEQRDSERRWRPASALVDLWWKQAGL